MTPHVLLDLQCYNTLILFDLGNFPHPRGASIDALTGTGATGRARAVGETLQAVHLVVYKRINLLVTPKHDQPWPAHPPDFSLCKVIPQY